MPVVEFDGDGDADRATGVQHFLFIDQHTHTLRLGWYRDEYRRTADGLTREEVPIEREEPLKRELASFLECAATGRTPKVSGFQATAALELAVEITKRINSAPRV